MIKVEGRKMEPLFKVRKRIALLCLLLGGANALQAKEPAPLRIMPLGDSITAGYTDAHTWEHPFEFGYRSGLYKRLKAAGLDFVFVGESQEPFDNRFGDPTHGGSVQPLLDLRTLGQNGHRGYGGWTIVKIKSKVAQWIEQDRPDVILLMIGINGISAKSPAQLNGLVETIFRADRDVALIVAQITPKHHYNQQLFDYNNYIREKLVPGYSTKGFAISTVDQYRHFLADPDNPKSIDATRLSNSINHPTNALYDQMAEAWFEGIQSLLNTSDESAHTKLTTRLIEDDFKTPPDSTKPWTYWYWLNGQRFRTLWMPLFELDVTDVLKPGGNDLEIVITSTSQSTPVLGKTVQLKAVKRTLLK